MQIPLVKRQINDKHNYKQTVCNQYDSFILSEKACRNWFRKSALRC